MLLAIDIGNTNTVFAVYEGTALRESWRRRTESRATCDEYVVFLDDVFRIAGLERTHIKDVIISSVVPEAERHIAQFCQKYLGQDPFFITKDCVPIAIDMERPEEVGADRLVNAVAVCQEYQLPAVVIDFGTATTFDVINADGSYSGGVIAPGIHLSVAALASAAAKLPRVDVQKPDHVIGKNTVSAIQSGIFWGYASMIEGVLVRIEGELGTPPTVIATGGLARLFADHVAAIQHVDDELIFKGLLSVHQAREA